MDIHHLKAFVSVFRFRSFSQASKKLNLTQPTVSSHIRALENEFNCRLFDRSGNVIVPLKKSEVLYEHSVELIEKVETLKKAIKDIKKDLSGNLKVGASTIPGVYLLPPAMSEFKKRYPEIPFQILISDSMGIIDSILKHELIMGVVGAKLDSTKIRYITYMDDLLIAVSSPDLAHTNRMTLRELTRLPIILREVGSGTRIETEKFLADRGIPLESLKIVGIFGSTDAVKQAVKAGLGVSILSKYSVADELRHGIVKEIKLTDIMMKRRFYIVTHNRRTLPKLYDKFLEHLSATSKKP